MALSLKPTAFAEAKAYPSINLVHSNSCVHCIRYMPAFEAFAKEHGTKSGANASLDTPLVTKIDAAKYRSSLGSPDTYLGFQEVSGFPTTLFYAGDGKTYESYKGPRTVEGLKEGWQEFQAKIDRA